MSVLSFDLIDQPAAASDLCARHVCSLGSPLALLLLQLAFGLCQPGLTLLLCGAGVPDVQFSALLPHMLPWRLV